MKADIIPPECSNRILSELILLLLQIGPATQKTLVLEATLQNRDTLLQTGRIRYRIAAITRQTGIVSTQAITILPTIPHLRA